MLREERKRRNLRVRERFEDTKRGYQPKDFQNLKQLLKAKKDKKTNSTLEPQEETSLPTL
jgi:hypothetical protein